MAAAIALVACGGSGASATSGAATTKAAAGCHDILGVGQAMERHTPASGSAIDHQLRQATANLDGAAQLDSRWGSLAHTAQSFVSAIEAGQVPADALTVQLSDGCQRFAGTSSSNAG